MKKLIVAFLMLFGLAATGQVIEGFSVELTPENQRMITIGVPVVMITKVGEKVTAEDLNKFNPARFDLSDGSTPIEIPEALPSAATFDSTWLNVIQCAMASEGIDCEDLGCQTLEEIDAGTWKVMFAGNIFRGLHTYWIQGQVIPILNYDNGVIRFNNYTVQIYQLIGNDKPVPIGQILKFHY